MIEVIQILLGQRTLNGQPYRGPHDLQGHS